MSIKALFLDRDGIVNIDTAYLHRQQDFIFVDGIFDVCHFFVKQGYQLFIVTNQAGIAKGLYDEQDFSKLTTWMEARFSVQSLKIQHTYYCPHHPDATVLAYKKDCQCRKPEPAMLLKAAQDFDIDLSQSVLIGDKNSDIQAAQRAGITQHYLIKSRYQENFNYESVKQMYQQLGSKFCGE